MSDTVIVVSSVEDAGEEDPPSGINDDVILLFLGVWASRVEVSASRHALALRAGLLSGAGTGWFWASCCILKGNVDVV